MKHQGEEIYKVYINHDPGMTLTYFTARSTCFAHAFEWGKLSKCHLRGNTLWKWAKGLDIYDSKKDWTPGAGLPPPMGNIHVYYHNVDVQRSSSLKWLDQSKPNFMWIILRKGERKFI